MKPEERNSVLLDGMGKVHARLVGNRRALRLAAAVASALPLDPPPGSLLDIGCGDGIVGALLGECRPGMSVFGVEVLPRPDCVIRCAAFDGLHTPFRDKSFDTCTLIDVLHHADDAPGLLREAARCARCCVIIKDHMSHSLIDACTLRFMDWVGNRPVGVPLPYNYPSATGWTDLFTETGLRVACRTTNLNLYPFPFSLIFGRQLHFVARLEPA